MIVLDTNVISEPLKPRPNQAVVRWLDAQYPETLYLTATSLAELLCGIAFLPSGRRKKGLATAMEELLTRLFEDRILAFDREAATAYASLVSHAMARGATISLADGQIAATAAVRGFAIATRDTAPFVAAGARVVNPWEE